MKQSSFQQLLKHYEPLIQAVVELFHPFVEAAVHDLKKGTLAAIYHNISQRKVGDSSPLKELNVSVEEFPDRFAPYYKTNWDGRPLKCTSITLRDSQGRPVGLICFNVDTSVMGEAHKILQMFLKTEAGAENPVEAFGGECETLANAAIQEYLKVKNLSLGHLNRDQKREVVQHLYRKGIFNFKQSVPFVARALHISRATVYNHLNQGG